jgi:uncharacterized protein
MTFKERYGPWALVTGASSGIGAEFARQLADLGLNLVLVVRRRPRLDDLAGYLTDRNHIQVKAVTADLSQRDLLPLILSETQSVDIGLLVNNAGFGLARKFLDHELEHELALLDVETTMRLPPVSKMSIASLMQQRIRRRTITCAEGVYV